MELMKLIAIPTLSHTHLIEVNNAIKSSSGEGIQKKFLQFDMVLGMGIRFSKTTAYKLGVAPWWPVCAKSNMATKARDLK